MLFLAHRFFTLPVIIGFALQMTNRELPFSIKNQLPAITNTGTEQQSGTDE
jgi:hypothetical protein